MCFNDLILPREKGRKHGHHLFQLITSNSIMQSTDWIPVKQLFFQNNTNQDYLHMTIAFKNIVYTY